MSKLTSSRSGKLVLNTFSSFGYQILTIICGLILPRFFLSYYGSAVNGLVNSISQFLSYVSLLDLGVGAVIQSAFYKPLADKNIEWTSRIFVSAKNFYNKVGMIILLYIIALCFVYPCLVIEEFGYISTLLLIVTMSISMFAQYYFGLVYQLLLTADQKHFVQVWINAGTLVANTVFSVILIIIGSPIQIVKLVSSIVYLLRPLIMSIYVKNHYSIDMKIKTGSDDIPQKWNGFAQHIAAVILQNTDVVVLTTFSTLQNVSIYSVYYLVVSGVKALLYSLTSGLTSTLGNMFSRVENNKFERTFSYYEWILHMVATLVFSITAVLITPFVLVYTKGIVDVDYNVPKFGFLLSFAMASITLQTPYKTIVMVVGHYKQTQASSIIEVAINVIVSIATVKMFGLIGVAIGTFLAMTYRMIYLEYYIRKNVIHRSANVFIKQLAIDILTMLIIIFATKQFENVVSNYLTWILLALKVSLVSLAITLGISFLFYRKHIMVIWNKFKNRYRMR